MLNKHTYVLTVYYKISITTTVIQIFNLLVFRFDIQSKVTPSGMQLLSVNFLSPHYFNRNIRNNSVDPFIVKREAGYECWLKKLSIINSSIYLNIIVQIHRVRHYGPVK